MTSGTDAMLAGIGVAVVTIVVVLVPDGEELVMVEGLVTSGLGLLEIDVELVVLVEVVVCACANPATAAISATLNASEIYLFIRYELHC